MKLTYNYKYSGFCLAIILMFFVEATKLLDLQFKLNFPVLRYLMATLATFFLLLSIWNCRQNFLEKRIFLFTTLSISLIIWSIYMIYQGMPQVFSGYQNHVHLKQLISGQLLIYLLPLLLIVKYDGNILRIIFKTCYNLSLILLLFIISFVILNGIDSIFRPLEILFNLSTSSAIMVLALPYFKFKEKLITVSLMFVMLLITALLARRTGTAYCAGVFLFTFWLLNFTTSNLVSKKRVLSLVSSFTIVGIFLGLLLINLDKFSILGNRSKEGFENRDVVFLEYVVDMDKKPDDWVYGRGINGMFKSHLSNFKSGQRDTIENGYLQMILKGGYIYLGLFVILSLFAIIQGFFNSSNLMTKAFAAYILLYYVEMIGFGLPSLTLKYMLIWIGIAVCTNKAFRNLSDYEIKNILNESTISTLKFT
ncbi:MAG: hypothetical protein IPG18_02850 [Saprospiraceae bacterium]|nr:hypothetical protein [Saprospiraceae bacterium]